MTQPQLTNQSDITASSNLGIRGQLNLDVITTDPSQGVQPLAITVIEPEQKISTVCSSLAKSRFIVSGRGGIAIDPRQQINVSSVLQDWRRRVANINPTYPIQVAPAPSPFPSEAVTWRKNNTGQVELVVRRTRPDKIIAQQISCRDLAQNSA